MLCSARPNYRRLCARILYAFPVAVSTRSVQQEHKEEMCLQHIKAPCAQHTSTRSSSPLGPSDTSDCATPPSECGSPSSRRSLPFDAYFRCQSRCRACGVCCALSMNHEGRDHKPKKKQGGCRYRRHLDNRTMVCLRCLEHRGKSLRVEWQNRGSGESTIQAYTNYLYRGWIIECPNCGIIYQQRAGILHTTALSPVEAGAVHFQIDHCWSSSGHLSDPFTRLSTGGTVKERISMLSTPTVTTACSGSSWTSSAASAQGSTVPLTTSSETRNTSGGRYFAIPDAFATSISRLGLFWKWASPKTPSLESLFPPSPLTTPTVSVPRQTEDNGHFWTRLWGERKNDTPIKETNTPTDVSESMERRGGTVSHPNAPHIPSHWKSNQKFTFKLPTFSGASSTTVGECTLTDQIDSLSLTDASFPTPSSTTSDRDSGNPNGIRQEGGRRILSPLVQYNSSQTLVGTKNMQNENYNKSESYVCGSGLSHFLHVSSDRSLGDQRTTTHVSHPNAWDFLETDNTSHSEAFEERMSDSKSESSGPEKVSPVYQPWASPGMYQLYLRDLYSQRASCQADH